MACWYTINGLSGTPRREIVNGVADFFIKKGKEVVTLADPTGTTYGKLANDLIVAHQVPVSSFTEALLYLTCSKEACDAIDWKSNQVAVFRGSFLETFGYQNQLSEWELADTRKIVLLFSKHIHTTYPVLSIILTENYETAEKRAGDHFEYKGNRAKYLADSSRFLRIKEHPFLQEIGLKIANIEVNSRDPQEVFQKEIEPLLTEQPYSTG